VFTSLHAAGHEALDFRSDREDLGAAQRALEALAEAAPDLAPRAAALAGRLAAGLAKLAPCAPGFIHGGLGADHGLVDGDDVRLIDWDEAANGDPHADWASLAADLRGRAIAYDWVEPLAREVLGPRFDPRRFAWQRAAAEARRVVENLQRGRLDW